MSDRKCGERAMKTRVLLLIVAGLLALPLTPIVAKAQCLPADGDSASLLTWAQKLASDTDEESVKTRSVWGISPVPLSEVELIADSKTCKKAAREYKNATGASGKAKAVHIVRIGTVYVVVDPENRGAADSEFVPHVVFDQQFDIVAKFAG